MLFRASLVVATLLALPAAAAAQDIPANCKGWERIAVHTEQITAGHFRLREQVEITCDTFKFFADQVDLYDEEDRLVATGNVLFTTPDTRITASRLDFNLETKTGTFYDAFGTSTVTPQVGERSMFGTQEADMHFRGETLEKLGEKKYRLTNGGFTSCLQPTPRWEFTSGSITINVDRYALATNTVFRVKGVPLLYLPVIYYPLEEDNRSTGFLMPGYGVSSVQGQTIRNAFFWAINRSMDFTAEHSFFSKTGQAIGGEFRYVASEASRGNVQASLLDEKASSTLLPNGALLERDASRTTQVRGDLTQQLPGNFRLGARADYTSSISTRTLYDQNPYQMTNPSSIVDANISGSLAGWQIGAQYYRNEVFQLGGTTDRSTLGGTSPRVNISRAESPIGNLPLYWSLQSEGVGILDESRNGDTTVERNRLRADIMPTLRAPLSKLPWLQVTTSLAWRGTWWSESRDPETNELVEEPVSRNYFELQANLVGPVFGRIFDTPGLGYAQRWKHVVEPSVTFGRTTSVDESVRDSIFGNESVDTVVGSVTRVTYGVTNRLYAKRGEGPAAIAREVVSLSVTQSYYTDPLAAERDANYRNTITGEPLSNRFSPLVFALRASPTQASSIDATVDFDTQFNAVRQLRAGTTVRARDFLNLSASWSQRRVIEGLPGFGESSSAHSLNGNASLRTRANRYGVNYGFQYDVKQSELISQALSAHYNAQCCGVGIEYRTMNIGRGANRIPNRSFNLMFSLAGIGSFSDFFGAFGADPYRRY